MSVNAKKSLETRPPHAQPSRAVYIDSTISSTPKSLRIHAQMADRQYESMDWWSIAANLWNRLTIVTAQAALYEANCTWKSSCPGTMPIVLWVLLAVAVVGVCMAIAGLYISTRGLGLTAKIIVDGNIKVMSIACATLIECLCVARQHAMSALGRFVVSGVCTLFVVTVLYRGSTNIANEVTIAKLVDFVFASLGNNTSVGAQ